MKTIELGFTEDLTEYWNAARPAGLPAGWSVYHARREGKRELPCIVIGDEGCPRVPGMPDTGRVALRVMVLSDIDDITPADHRAVAGIMDAALDALLALFRGYDAEGNAIAAEQPLARSHVHDFLLETPESAVVEKSRQEYTVLKRTAVVSRYRGG